MTTMLRFLNLLRVLRHRLPKPFYPQSQENQIRSSSRVKWLFPKLGRQACFSGQASWTKQTNESQTSMRTTSTNLARLCTKALALIDHQYTKLKLTHRDLVTPTALSTKQKLAASQNNLAKKSFKKSFAPQKATLKSLHAKLTAANLKVAECKLKEATVNAERKLLRKQVQAGISIRTSNKRKDMAGVPCRAGSGKDSC
jgi:hypothetical protein